MNETLTRLVRPDLQNFVAYSSALPDRNLVRLHANESPYDCGEAMLNRYPEPQPRLLIERLACLYEVGVANVLATRGSDDAIDLLVRCFCRAGQDSIVICPPTFGMYEVAARIQNAGVIRVPLSATDDFAPDAAAIVAACTKTTRLVFICTPNNPTGNLVNPQTVTRLCEALQEKALIVVDEAYIEFAAAGSFATRIGEYPNLVVLRTLSKAHALAGARCGALVGAAELIDIVRPALPPYALPTPTVEAAIEALTDDRLMTTRERIAGLREEKVRLRRQLDRLDVVRRTWPSEGNFILAEVDNRASVITACRDQGILIRDMGTQTGLERHVRITVGTPAQNQQLLSLLGDLS